MRPSGKAIFLNPSAAALSSFRPPGAQAGKNSLLLAAPTFLTCNSPPGNESALYTDPVRRRWVLPRSNLHPRSVVCAHVRNAQPDEYGMRFELVVGGNDHGRQVHQK